MGKQARMIIGKRKNRPAFTASAGKVGGAWHRRDYLVFIVEAFGPAVVGTSYHGVLANDYRPEDPPGG